MEIIENSLIPIMENKKGEKLVNARELHTFLEVKTRFTKNFEGAFPKYK